jgi:hypothetical protein
MSPPSCTPSLSSCTIPSKKRSYRAFPSVAYLTRSFDALEVYIQSLLARTQSDVGRLRLLHEQASAFPEHTFDTLTKRFFDYLISSTIPLFTQPTAQ